MCPYPVFICGFDSHYGLVGQTPIHHKPPGHFGVLGQQRELSCLVEDAVTEEPSRIVAIDRSYDSS
jgi:hypothetical protein